MVTIHPIRKGLKIKSPDHSITEPISVQVIRTLGCGRAARAQLVDAQMPDGSVVRCVEKVFAPGRLTRWIYRAAFASPFAYQSNRDAILASYYRRRVAAAVLATGETEVDIAEPLYVRYCDEDHCWVLAATWIDGRGIRPLPVDRRRIRRWFRREQQQTPIAEVDQLVTKMQAAEERLIECGLAGSGWQVAPRALVSTANLLRQANRYTIIDLESGIPALLVPRYIALAFRSGTAPPFDDLDADRLRNWLAENDKLLTFRLGPARAEHVASDVERLIDYSQRWKDAEIAPLRSPWRLLRSGGMHSYQQATVDRWQRTGIIDAQCAADIESSPNKARAIWWALLVPTFFGHLIATFIGRQQTRSNVKRWFTNRLYRRWRWQRHIKQCQNTWSQSGRIRPSASISTKNYFANRALSVLPRSLHRFLVDPDQRQQTAVSGLLFLLSGRYQAWLGQKHINASISRWVNAKRITSNQGRQLCDALSGHEIRVYTRGFGMHVALKFLAPIVIPAKIGSVMAFAAGGSPWFLVPLAATPVLRLIVTIGNWFHARDHHVRHREAMAVCWLPFIGSIAFPLQMYATRPELATFLIRDAASRAACKVPIYGGADSRTEMFFVRSADFLIEVLDLATSLTGAKNSAATPNLGQPVNHDQKVRTRLGTWLDQQAKSRISVQLESPPTPRRSQAA